MVQVFLSVKRRRNSLVLKFPPKQQLQLRLKFEERIEKEKKSNCILTFCIPIKSFIVEKHFKSSSTFVTGRKLDGKKPGVKKLPQRKKAVRIFCNFICRMIFEMAREHFIDFQSNACGHTLKYRSHLIVLESSVTR